VSVLAAGAAIGSSSSSLSATRLAPLAFQQRHDPVKIKNRRDDGTWQSSNWSGYSVTGSTGSITEASGSWIVPQVTCPSTSAQYSSFWVGIDGFYSNTVEQTGTDSDCNGTSPQYYAWFEFYPHAAYEILPAGIGTISVGDSMSADVKYSPFGRSYTVTITDNTTGRHFSTSQRMNAQSSSAEWIAEAPSGSGGVLAIANFGTASFSNSKATRSGKTGVISSFLEPSCNGSVACSNIVQYLQMVQSNGAGATPSGLTGAGGDFTVTYNGPTSAAPKK
jgi:hypothetical protein